MPQHSFSDIAKAYASRECNNLHESLSSILDLDAQSRTIIFRAGADALVAATNSSLLRVLILELHAAKLTGQIPEGSSDAQFEAFALEAQRPSFVSHLEARYPALLTKLGDVISNRRRAIELMTSRLVSDRERLTSTFGVPCDRLTALQIGVGDSHDRGQAVARIQFRGGALMYKPRPMRLDVALDAFLDRLFPDNPDRIRVPKTADCIDYGWAALVAHKYCEDENSIDNFYRNLGSWISVMHLLGGSDIHCENMIAAGSVPVIVDPECLFAKNWVARDVSKGEAYVEAIRMISGSVLRSGIVPYRSPFDALKGVELSSMAASMAAGLEITGPVLLEEGTANARIATGKITLDTPKSIPSPENTFAEHVGNILDGFSQTNALLKRIDRDGRLNSLVQVFLGSHVRDLYRPTQIYAEIRQMLWHPASLHSPEDARVRAKNILGNAGGLTPAQVDSEIECLTLRDIPIYRSKVDSQRIDSTLDLWRSNSLETQEMILRASIVAAELNARDDNPAKTREVRVLGSAHASIGNEWDDKRRELAEWAVHRILRFSIVAKDGSSTWVSPLRGVNGWMIEPVEGDFYNGVGGIAFALAGYLHEMDQGRANIICGVREKLESCLTSLRSIEANAPPVRGGGFNGTGAKILTWLLLYSLLKKNEFLDYATEHARTLSIFDCDSIKSLDIIAGEAGLIVPLLNLYDITHDPNWLSLAKAIGNRLASAAEANHYGVGWKSDSYEHPLGGFAHGATGIGWALARLSLTPAGTVEERDHWSDIAQRAFRFEESLYDPEYCAWRDIRRLDERVFSNAWCHGGIGIGLAASDLYTRTGAKVYLCAMRTALASALKLGWQKKANLCHGNLGMREMVLRTIDTDDYASKDALHHGDRVVISEIQNLMCDEGALAEELFIPGLMTGLSGIAHGLCRMHRECDLPSPLLMEVGRPCKNDSWGARVG